MKKLILLLLSSVFFISCSKEASSLPDDLGDFKLGMSMYTVETLLNSKGLNEISTDGPMEMFEDDFPKYSYGIINYNGHGRTEMTIRFSTSSPYLYDENKWEWIFLEFYHGELYSITLASYYEGRSGIEACFKAYKDEEKKLHSRYKKLEKETNQGGDYANVTYENGPKSLCLIFTEEGMTPTMVELALYDSEIGHKAYKESSDATDSAVEAAEVIVEEVED